MNFYWHGFVPFIISDYQPLVSSTVAPFFNLNDRLIAQNKRALTFQGQLYRLIYTVHGTPFQPASHHQIDKVFTSLYYFAFLPLGFTKFGNLGFYKKSCKTWQKTISIAKLMPPSSHLQKRTVFTSTQTSPHMQWRKWLEEKIRWAKTNVIKKKLQQNVVQAVIDKASNLNRLDILKKADKAKTNRVVLALTYHPKLPSVSNIIKKHWRTLSKDPIAKEIFPQPPMVAFKQPPNLKNKLCRAALPKSRQHPKRKITGTKPCNKSCSICPYVLKSDYFISTHTKEKFTMTGS
jgi:hypothetical protein